MFKVKRIRYVRLSTPEIGRQIDHYQSLIGLGIVVRDRNCACMATEAEEFALVLEQADSPGLTSVAFEVGPYVQFSEVRDQLAKAEIAAAIRSDPLPGVAEVLSFCDVEGTRIELVKGWNPTQAKEPAGGAIALGLGHIAFYSSDPRACSRYYDKMFGFRVSDWISDDSFIFMRCGSDHHTVNFARGDHRRLHHVAFQLHDGAQMHQACDLLGRNKIRILWGPLRHGPGHNVAVYHRDPDGHLVEFFYDIDRMTDEELGYFEPKPWHTDRPQRPRAWTRGCDRWGLGPTPELTEFSQLPPANRPA